MSRFDSQCGNIYRDLTYECGVRHANYFVDCAGCSKEIALETVGVCKRAKTVAREKGWFFDEESKKWLCLDCTRSLTALHLKIENLITGLRSYGYLVTVKAVPGHEEEFYAIVRDGFSKVEDAAQKIALRMQRRETDADTLARLHRQLPEPFWGANAATD